jgi:hypothetical protein
MAAPDPKAPIVCDMTGAQDTEAERLAEYAQLFAGGFIDRARTREGVLFRFRADEGIEAWVRDLAGREKACCAFFSFTISSDGAEVIWQASVPDNDITLAILDEFYALPDTAAAGVEALVHRLDRRGLEVIRDSEQRRRVKPTSGRNAG